MLKKNKVLLLLAAVIVAVLALAGCGTTAGDTARTTENERPKAETKELVIYSGRKEKLIQPVLDAPGSAGDRHSPGNPGCRPPGLAGGQNRPARPPFLALGAGPPVGDTPLYRGLCLHGFVCALYIRFWRHGPGTDDIHLSLYIFDGRGIPRFYEQQPGRGRDDQRLRALAGIPAGHPAPAQAGHRRRQPVGGPVCAGGFRDSGHAQVPDFFQRRLHPTGGAL